MRHEVWSIPFGYKMSNYHEKPWWGRPITTSPQTPPPLMPHSIISDQDLLSLYMMTIQKYELNLFMDSGFFVKDKIGEHFGQNWKGLRETYGWMCLCRWGEEVSFQHFTLSAFHFHSLSFPCLHTLFLYTKDNLLFSFSLKIWCLIACFWIVFWNNLRKMSGLKMADVALRQLLGSWNIWEGKKRKKKQIQTIYIPYLYKE